MERSKLGKIPINAVVRYTMVFPKPHKPIVTDIPAPYWNRLVFAAKQKHMGVIKFIKWLLLESPDDYELPDIEQFLEKGGHA